MQGEVSEREDLLDGRVRLDLDGDAAGWVVALSLGWRRGREGVALDEGELTLEDGSRELYASLDSGTVETDEETGAANVVVTLTVDDSTDDWLASPERISCSLAIGGEQWSGELRLGDE
jgi:hypothetical protein